MSLENQGDSDPSKRWVSMSEAVRKERPRGILVGTARMDIREGNYCVYAHIHNDEIFYIGQGRRGRPCDMTQRNGHWHQYVREIEFFTIEILGFFDTMSAARQEEGRLLDLLEPICNIHGTSLLVDAIPPATVLHPLKETAPAVRLLRMQQRVAALEAEKLCLEKERCALLKEVSAHREQAQFRTASARRLWHYLWRGYA